MFLINVSEVIYSCIYHIDQQYLLAFTEVIDKEGCIDKRAWWLYRFI